MVGWAIIIRQYAVRRFHFRPYSCSLQTSFPPIFLQSADFISAHIPAVCSHNQAVCSLQTSFPPLFLQSAVIIRLHEACRLHHQPIFLRSVVIIRLYAGCMQCMLYAACTAYFLFKLFFKRNVKLNFIANHLRIVHFFTLSSTLYLYT